MPQYPMGPLPAFYLNILSLIFKFYTIWLYMVPLDWASLYKTSVKM